MSKTPGKRSFVGLISGLVCVGTLITLAPPHRGQQ